ncbi:MAG: hypothetical protein WAT23_19045 [Chromatiaceae bacterium]
MKTWVEEVREQSLCDAQAREQAARDKADQAAARGVTMKEKVRRVIRAMPEHEREIPRSIDYFVDKLTPKYTGARAAARDVARGLRENGWSRQRTWRASEVGFRSYWLPPPG